MEIFKLKIKKKDVCMRCNEFYRNCDECDSTKCTKCSATYHLFITDDSDSQNDCDLCQSPLLYVHGDGKK